MVFFKKFQAIIDLRVRPLASSVAAACYAGFVHCVALNATLIKEVPLSQWEVFSEIVKKNWPTAVLLIVFYFVYQNFTQTNQMLISEMIANNRATVEKLDKSIDRLSEALNKLEARQSAVEIKIDQLRKGEKHE